MSPERAWEIAGRLVPKGLFAKPEDYFEVRMAAAITIADYDEPPTPQEGTP